VVTADRKQCLLLYTVAAWQGVESKLMGLPSLQAIERRMQRLMVGHATDVPIDVQGRIVVPSELCQYAGLKNQVVLVRKRDGAEIWDRERWELHVQVGLSGAMRSDDAVLPESLQFLADASIVDESAVDAIPAGAERVGGVLATLEDVLAPRVLAIPASLQILSMVQADSKVLQSLSAEDLETFVCERLERMGFVSTRIGATREADGGIDIVICPRGPSPFPFLLAVQVKSHRGGRKTPVSAVRDFAGTVRAQPVRGGVLVTNTTFTMDARWFAEQQRNLIQLRDFSDLSRWIRDEFAAHELYREIPSSLQLRPGVTLQVHEWLRDALQPAGKNK
jgi:MraZ protein